MNQTILIVFLLGLFAASSAGFAQTDREWREALNSAQARGVKGETIASLQAYDQALRLAETPDQRAQTRLAKAELLSRSAHHEQDAQALREQAARLYEEVLSEASGNLLLQAQNNFAVLLLGMGQYPRALTLLESVERNSRAAGIVNAADRSHYLYNYAQALERSGQDGRAFQKYREAMDLDINFKPASQSAWRLTQESRSESIGIPQTIELVEQLTARMDLLTAKQYLRSALTKDHWVGHPRFHYLFTSLVRYFTAATVGPTKFSEEWAADLEKLRPRLRQDSLRRVDQIVTVYRGNLPLDIGGAGGDHFQQAWRQPQGSIEAFSTFAKMVGDEYSREGTPRLALPRYLLAWNLNQANMDAALYMVNLLVEAREQVDPTGRVLEEWIGKLFQGKGDAYLGEDWPNILRFHTILGTIFQRQKRWGSSFEPLSAIFQLEHALAAQRKLQGPSPLPAQGVPGLYDLLGSAYEAVKNQNRAWEHYLVAAEGYLAANQIETASTVLSKAERLTYMGTPQNQKRRQDLRLVIDQRRRTVG